MKNSNLSIPHSHAYVQTFQRVITFFIAFITSYCFVELSMISYCSISKLLLP